ncbi:MAG: xanthine dehydrogenase family protein subunit M [Armatimonadetes bacterium]|nr:xanthine dehydrogenase family protein subunit M [Armatimonadota bacterium]MCX7967737.1 xanthine dehydrogenase family protein subunit M [Armatimonadota bacterium]MDW8142743.1 xanthine dehydrogenase family protein subunit M [Armatimonadota bacterium]
MRAFEYVKPTTVAEVIRELGRSWEAAKILAGGTDLLGELKEGIIAPQKIVNLKGVADLGYIRFSEKEGLKLGALTTLAEIAAYPVIRQRYTALAEAARSVATPQIRNIATIGGNLCQRPRCWYYRDENTRCLKKGGPICFAYNGENKFHAILGGGPCYIVHPSDCAPALIAFKASVTIVSPRGKRTVPLEEFFLLPSRRMDHETVLEPDEIVTEIQVPTPLPNTRSTYLKFRERDSFDFAVVGAAVVVRLRGGVCEDVRIVLSGVAPIPWRSPEAEAVLKGKKITPSLAEQAAKAAVAKSQPLAQNAYKVPLTQAIVKQAILKTVA